MQLSAPAAQMPSGPRVCFSGLGGLVGLSLGLVGCTSESSPGEVDGLSARAPARTRPAAVFTVTNTDSSGPGSLFDALAQADSAGEPSQVVFNLPDSGEHRILADQPLNLGADVTVDGCTQPGADCSRWPLTLNIVVYCQDIEQDVGFLLGGDRATLRGVVVQGCVAGARIEGAQDALVERTYIGTDVTGTHAAPTWYGVHLTNASNARIGSNLDGVDDALERNLLSGAVSASVYNSSSTDVWVGGNYIGTDVSGEAAIPSSVGIYSVDSAGLEGVENLVSGNSQGIVLLKDAGGKFTGNRVGVSASGLALPNTDAGMLLQHATGLVQVGGEGSGEGNVVAYNVRGIVLEGDDTSRYPLTRNQLFQNGDRGISLGDANNLNDVGDCDTGVNGIQNAPEILSVASEGAMLRVTYRVDSSPECSDYPLTVELFVPDESGEEGQTWLHSDLYLEDESQTAKTLTVTPATAYDGSAFLVGTATDASGRTSGFTLRDADGDGFRTPDDCDDSNSDIHPGAEDPVGEGGDTDCDGIELCFANEDGDLYAASGGATVESVDDDCTDPGEASSSAATGDCDDSDPDINPSATEQAGDGVDADCNNRELCFSDADQDGYLPEAPSTVTSLDADCADSGEGSSDSPAGDCDDSLAEINPEALESLSDGVDSDCDGEELCAVDSDGDGYRDGSLFVASDDLDCADAGEGLISDPLDCNDSDSSAGPVQTAYADTDGDGVGVLSDPQSFCGQTPPAGYALESDDNCSEVPNPEQQDGDLDGIGDACDEPQDYLPQGNGFSCQQGASMPGSGAAAQGLVLLLGVWGIRRRSSDRRTRPA